VDELAESVLRYVRRHKLLKAGDRAGVAVSGGADSVGLLRLLLELRQELGVVLSVVHFNHNLRGTESEADERFVAQLAGRYELELHCGRQDVAGHAKERHLSTEAAARELRYGYFGRLVDEERLGCIATGHTLDDQAETVLLRLVRGAGTRGLAGIYPRANKPQSADHSSLFPVIRPLLGTRRAQLETYLKGIGQGWREDSSNRDLRHARNRIRHGIVPRLERTLNPRLKETLAETAEIARSEEEYWQAEVERVMPGMWEAGSRRLTGVHGLPLALQRRVVRAAAESIGMRLEFRQVDEILGQGGLVGPPVGLPGGWLVARGKDRLEFIRSAKTEVGDYAYVLAVPGMVQVPEIDGRFEAVVVPADALPGYNPDHILELALLQKELTVRNWRAGDRFWPAHSKSPKKVKELLQARKLAGAERKLWPVVVSGDEIVWVRGFPAPARLRPREGAKQALVIQERVTA